MSEDPAPPRRFAARHFDGLTAESHPAEAWIDGYGVGLIDVGGGVRRWPFAELTLVRGERPDEPVQLERRSQPVEVLIVEDRAFLGALRAALPKGTRIAGGGGWTPGVAALAALMLAGIALVFALYRFAIPALSDYAADRMPPEWERSLRDAVIEGMAPAEMRMTDPRVIAPAETIHRELVGSAGDEVRLLVVRSDVPNAFAAPGGSVVITTGLLRALRSPDELAAVIAHEHGHVRRRHVVRAIVRRVSLGVLIGLVAGDASALSGGVRVAGELGSLSYSREYERQADDEAASELARHGVSPLALAHALESIRRTSGSGPAIGFLSTHPAAEERARRIRAAAATLEVVGARPGSGDSAWAEMKAALEEQAKAP